MTKTSSASDACYRLPPGFCSSAEAGARLLCASVALESQLAKQKDISSFRPQGKLLREQDMLSTSNIPEDDFQAYRWGLIRQLLHSSCLANTFFPAEILPNRLKGNFPFSSISRTTHSKKRSAIARLAKADLRHPLSPPLPCCLWSVFSSPTAHPHPLPCGRGDSGSDPRALLQKSSA